MAGLTLQWFAWVPIFVPGYTPHLLSKRVVLAGLMDQELRS